MEGQGLRLEDLQGKITDLERDLKEYKDRKPTQVQSEVREMEAPRWKESNQGAQTARTEGVPVFPQYGYSSQQFPGFGMPFSSASPFQALPWWLIQQQDPEQRRKARALVLEQCKILEEILGKMRQRSLSSSMRLPSMREILPSAREEDREELDLRLKILERDHQRTRNEDKNRSERRDLSLITENRELKEKLREKEEEIAELRREKEDLEQELHQFREQTAKLEEKISKIQHISHEIPENPDNSKSEISSSALKSQLEKLTKENSNLAANYMSLQRNYDQLILERHGFGRISARNFEKQVENQVLYTENSDGRRSISQAPPEIRPVIETKTKIQRLEHELMTLQRDKQRVLSDLDRLPEVSRSAATIRKRTDWERELSILETNINVVKQKLRQFTRLN